MNAPVAHRLPRTLLEESESSLDGFLAQLAAAPLESLELLESVESVEPFGLESEDAFPPSEDVLLPSHEAATLRRERKKHQTQVIEPQVRPGSQVGPYHLTRELGRGGMGVVFQAVDPSGREVALKLILSLDHPRHLARFEREGQITAALDHPGIVRIHNAGEHHGMPYLVYELVEGAQTLDDVFEYYSLEERAEMVRDAARALGHAHERGVIHRDVKPENILIGEDGRVRVADFGLAEGRGLKRLTKDGTFLGTPGFAAPEQLTGRWMQIGPHSDVWSLGAVLYTVFTARLPFNGRTFNELAHRTTSGRVRPPSKYAPHLSDALEAVCLKALSRSPGDRYPNAAALADDLDRALTGKPLVQSPAPRRRLPILAGVAGLLLISTAGAFGRTPPARLDLLQGASGWSADAHISGVVTGADPTGLSLTVAGEEVDLRGERFETQLDLADGRHQVELVLRRGDVVLARDQRTIQVDATAPRLTLSGPHADTVAPDGKLWVSGRIDDLTACRVGVDDSPGEAIGPGQTFSIPVTLREGRTTIRVWAADAGGNVTTVTRTVWAPPTWYRETPAAKRAPLPLPAGVEFGAQPGEYRHVADGSVLVYVWLETPEALFQRAAGVPHNFQMRSGPFVAFRRGFFVGKHEVTWGQYVTFAQATGHALPRPATSLPADHPASGLSWFDAQAYCAWAGLRLPTEAQWEYAARSSRHHVWPWGDRAKEDAANLRGTRHDRFEGTSPVGSFPQGASAFGCLDMAGNVWEWTADWSGTLKGNHVLVDPTGPSDGQERTLRGGSYLTTLNGARSGLRSRQDPHQGRPTSGFRVLLPTR